MASSRVFSVGLHSCGSKDHRSPTSSSGQLCKYYSRFVGRTTLSESCVKNPALMAVNGRPDRNLPSGSEWHFSERIGNENVPKQYGDNFTEPIFPNSLAQFQVNPSTEDILQRRPSKEKGMHVKKYKAWESCNGDGFSKSKTVGLDGKIYKNTVGNEGEVPYRILSTGQKIYLDELDVLTLLDPPEYLEAFDYHSYNHAFFIWKKIGDIPEERRNHLIDLLTPRHISKMWEFAGLQYGTLIPFDVDMKELLLGSKCHKPLQHVAWIDQTTEGISWLGGKLKKVFFLGTDGTVYGRVVTGLVEKITMWSAPSCFQATNSKKVLATNEDCSMAFEYANAYIGLKDSCVKFPRPVKHPWSSNYRTMEYIRLVGPGMFVGQLWREGKSLEQGSKKLVRQFVMIKDFKNVSDD